MNPNAINNEIILALGIEAKFITEVTITLRPNQVPEVQVTKALLDAEALTEVVEKLQLVEKEPK